MKNVLLPDWDIDFKVTAKSHERSCFYGNATPITPKGVKLALKVENRDGLYTILSYF